MPVPPDLPPTECVVHVDPEGDDDAMCGATASACRTLSHAITLADAGCTIALGAGTYFAASGEAPPLGVGRIVERDRRVVACMQRHAIRRGPLRVAGGVHGQD